MKDGNYPRAAYALGVALEDQGRFAEAKLAYEQANSFAPAIYKLGLLAAKAGEFKKAADLFRDAASRKGQHVPASRNNLGVMLARLGFLKDAEKEFVVALKESDGRFEHAARNLRLCRWLMSPLNQPQKPQNTQNQNFDFVDSVFFAAEARFSK